MAKTKAPKKQKFDSAYKKAVEEIDKDRVNEIKFMLKATLESIFERQKKVSELTKEIQFLKADIEDLKRGKLDKIKQRREKDTQLAKISKIDVPKLENWSSYQFRSSLPATTTSTIDLINGIDGNFIVKSDLADLVNTALNS